MTTTEQTPPTINGPKQVDFSKPFTANGKKYAATERLSIARYEQYEKYQPLIAFDVDFQTIFKHLNKMYGFLNDRKFADASVVCHGLMSSIKGILDEKRENPALLMAALFINGEGEDPGVFDEEVQRKKIEDWRKEGFDAFCFFRFALNFIQGFKKEYSAYIAETGEEPSEVNLKK